MKRFFKTLLVLLLVLVPVTFANAKKTTTTTTASAKAPNTVNIYVFYGDGCPHCADLEDYIKNNLKKDSRVKDYINVTYYETWYDTTNQQFLSVVAQTLGVEIKGVPFMLIGDQYFSGYGSQMNEDIVAKIVEQKQNSKYVDVIEKAKKASGITPVVSNPETGVESKEDEKTDSGKNDTVGIIILGVTVVIIIAIIFTRHTSDDEEEIEEDSDEEEDEDDDEDEESEEENDEDSEDEDEEEVVEEKKTVNKTAATKKKAPKKKNKRK